jgi:subtilisin family serine protease
MRYFNRSQRTLAFILALFTAFTLSIAQGSPRSRLAAPPMPAVASASLANHWDSRPKAKFTANDTLVSVIVKLDVASLAAYEDSLPGLAATSPRLSGATRLDSAAPNSLRYLTYVDGRLHDFEARAAAALPQARLIARYRYVFGGAALIMPESQVAQLAALPGVVKVWRDDLLHIDTDRSPEFIRADVIWRALAANPNLGDGGEGVIVGVIDTGIWPEHQSFADDGSYPPAPPRWHGVCEAPHDTSAALTCNHKLIGARQSLAVYKSLIGLNQGEFDSARDNNGHGTHTASTAAGNANVPTEIFGQPRGVLSGIAPRAYVAAYKGLGDAGGYGADLVMAIDQAIADGVDVINFPISRDTATDPYDDSVALALLDAYRAGVFVAVSAGNGGPNPGTIGSPANAPWVMSAAASTTDRQFISKLTLKSRNDQLTVRGVSITEGVIDKPVVHAAALNDPRCENPLSSVVTGTIVLCMRGGNARAEKSANVKAGGGAGMILANTDQHDVETDNHWVPTIHVDNTAGAKVVAFTTAHSDTTILGNIMLSKATTDPDFGDVLAAFSARGPLPDDQLGISKPDVTAPGVQILAGNTPAPSLSEDGPAGQLFQSLSGTSMASSHVAGAGALLRALHPDWTPGQIKSALMTTARRKVYKQDDVTRAGPYDRGSGRIDLSNAGDPGLTLDIPAEMYTSGKGHLQDLNYPSISVPSMPGRLSVVRVVHSELDTDSTWIAAAHDNEDFAVTINPTRISVPARGYASFVVSIDAGAVPEGAYVARIELDSDDDKRTLHLPVSFVRRQPVVTLEQHCERDTIKRDQLTTCTISAVNNGLDTATVSIRDKVPAELAVRASSVVSATYDRHTNTVSFTGVLPQHSSHVISFQVRGKKSGDYLNIAEMTANTFAGTNIATARVKVIGGKEEDE